MRRFYCLLALIFACSPEELFSAPYKLGIEAIPRTLIQKLKNKSIGLITNQTGRDQHGHRTIDLLRQHGLTIITLFSPEHGLDGDVVAGKLVEDSIDKKTGIPVKSLYQEGSGKKISRSLLQNIEVLMVDLQDCGMRHFTYISTLMATLEAAAAYNKEIIVFDRPNPLGAIMEGSLVEPPLKSFVSIAPIPVRHGMTFGELACYFNERVLKKHAQLTVVWMEHYDRRDGMAGCFPAKLSPNLNSLQACYGYSFLGLLGEIAPFEIGIKIGRPFQALMLPQKCTLSPSQWRRLGGVLRGYGIETYYTSCSSKQFKEQYTGLLFGFKNINSVPAFQVLLDVLDFFKETKLPITFSNLFAKAIGTKKIQAYFSSVIDHKSLVAVVNNDLGMFMHQAQPYFHYKPSPRVLLLR